MMIGRRGGEVVPAATLDRLERHLLRYRVVLSRNADAFLAGRAASGIFRVYKDGSATIFLRSDPTRYEVAHELKHYEHFVRVGADAYRNLTRVQQEQDVFDKLRNSRHWNTFTPIEQKHATDYLRLIGGAPW